MFHNMLKHRMIQCFAKVFRSLNSSLEILKYKSNFKENVFYIFNKNGVFSLYYTFEYIIKLVLKQ